MVWYPGQRVHTSGGYNFRIIHDKVIKLSGFSFFDGCIHLTKSEQNPCGSGGKFFKI